ncbi:hypothetical protein [Paratissierella segnis]|uniref:Uncharacterized protein n=1 Tax=Paratissierella segnis TaxID=2763679 RepID=A0A926EQT6_9FIRM|nr:hypothetical protein [Paratissierella segnis]MBC8586805.1 hypothetical protein [Paratissierella segnis]
MFKYMRYEIKGTHKFMGLLILFVLGASTGIQLFALNASKKYNDGLDGFGKIPNLLMPLLVLMIFGAFVTALFYIIGSFRKELYEDRGYLTFSLPLSGNQILGSKMVAALMWAVAIGLSVIVYNALLGSILFGFDWVEGVKYVFNIIPSSFTITIGLFIILSSVITLLLIYFAITLSKVSIKNKKIGGLWFIIFLILNSFVNYLILKVSGVFPYYLDLNTFKITGLNSLITKSFMSYVDMGFFVTGNGTTLVNIFSFIFSILIAVGTFLGTSYLIERKIDL